MKFLLLKSAILQATVTEANLNYIGSITIDEDLMDKANLREYEKVTVVDDSNGERLETYVIKGERGTGVMCMNGAAAHLVHEGDRITVLAFTWTDSEESPRFIVVGPNNRFQHYVDPISLDPISL